MFKTNLIKSLVFPVCLGELFNIKGNNIFPDTFSHGQTVIQ